MKAEYDFCGVYVSSVVVTGLCALVVLFFLQRGIRAWGINRLVFHPALVEVALFLILWASALALFSWV